MLMLSAAFACASLHAQSLQFLPEIDTYLKINSGVRVYFQAKDDREGGDPLQATLGPGIQFYLKPLLRLRKLAAFDLNDAKKRPIGVRGWISIYHCSECGSQESVLDGCDRSFSGERLISNYRQESRGLGLEGRAIHLALSQ